MNYNGNYPPSDPGYGNGYNNGCNGNPYQSGGNPYQSGGSQYPYMPPPKKRLRDNPDFPGYKKLFLIGLIVGAGFVMYPCMSDLYVFFIRSNTTVYNLYTNNYNFQLLCEMLYSFFCVGFPFLLVLVLLRSTSAYTKPLPLGKPYNARGAVLLVVAGLGLCFVGSFISNYISAYVTSFGVEFYSYSDALEVTPVGQSPLTAILLTLHSAVIPALVEEFVFRGVVLQSLRRYGDWFAIFASAALFGIMHANMIQVPFALVAGLALGYCAVVTGSLWPGIILHFINNFISVLYTLLLSYAGQSAANTLSLAVSYGCVIIGIFALFIYRRNNRNMLHLRPNTYRHMTVGGTVGAYFLMPTMIVGVVRLVFLTLTDIVGFTELF